MFLNKKEIIKIKWTINLNRKHEMFLNCLILNKCPTLSSLNRKHEMFLNVSFVSSFNIILA